MKRQQLLPEESLELHEFKACLRRFGREVATSLNLNSLNMPNMRSRLEATMNTNHTHTDHFDQARGESKAGSGPRKRVGGEVTKV